MLRKCLRLVFCWGSDDKGLVGNNIIALSKVENIMAFTKEALILNRSISNLGCVVGLIIQSD